MKYVNLASDLLREKTDIAPGANDAFWGMSGKKREGALSSLKTCMAWEFLYSWLTLQRSSESLSQKPLW